MSFNILVHNHKILKPVSIYNTVIFLTMEGSIYIAVKKLNFSLKYWTLFKTSYDIVTKNLKKCEN